MFRVFLTGLEVYAFHGVPDEEQAVGHRYRIDADCLVRGDAPTSDDVGQTLDYGALGAVIIAAATNQRYRTVERLAQVLAETVLERFPAASEIRMRVAKRLPPANLIAEEAGAELTLRR